MKHFITFFFLKIFFIFVLTNHQIKAEEISYPYPDFQLENTYQIDDGKTVYIEQTEWGHTIWGKDKSSRELNKISHVWFFYGLAKECNFYGKILKNLLFASQKEYYMWGGINENFTIRVYHLYEPHPHFTYHTDIGMVPDMDEAKAWCSFYKPTDL